MKICKFCKEVSMKVIPDNGQSSANTSRKSNKTRTEENGAIAYISTFMPKMQTCSRTSKVQNMSSEVNRSSQLRSHFEHGLHHSFGHVWSMYRSSPFRSTLNTGYITALDMCEVWSNPFRSTWNTGYITALDMCEVCTEAVHSIALWTRVTSQLWTCVKYMYRSSPLRSSLNTGYITALDVCEVYTEVVHSLALWTQVSSQLWTCVKCVPKTSAP